MALYRLTTLFQLTTAPAGPFTGSSRQAGWSESYWSNQTPAVFNPNFQQAQLYRSNLLPVQATIVGGRIQAYTINGNRLLPGGAQSFSRRISGTVGYACDLPNVSLMLIGVGGNGVNTNRFTLRGIPDAYVVTGEFQPDNTYVNALAQYVGILGNSNFGFVGRDVTQGLAGVNSYANNVINVTNIPAGLAPGGWIRFVRVYDATGKPVKGKFLVSGITGNAITIQNGPNQVVTTPSGNIRYDLLTFLNFLRINTGRAVARKVGRPSVAFRGRRSKRRTS